MIITDPFFLNVTLPWLVDNLIDSLTEPMVFPTGGERAVDWIPQLCGQSGGPGQDGGPAPPPRGREHPGSDHAYPSHLWLSPDRGMNSLPGCPTPSHPHFITDCSTSLLALPILAPPTTCTLLIPSAILCYQAVIGFYDLDDLRSLTIILFNLTFWWKVFGFFRPWQANCDKFLAVTICH